MAHIDHFLLLGDTHVTLGILSSFVAHQPSYFMRIVPLSFLSFLASFDKIFMQVCGNIMCLGSWEFF
jgi:hypothetical protein